MRGTNSRNPHACRLNLFLRDNPLRRFFTTVLVFGALLGLFCFATSDTAIKRIADESVATALASIPSITPQPSATPKPDSTPITIPSTPTPFVIPPFPTPLPTATPISFPPTVTPQPTTTPQPTATPVIFPPTPTPAPTPTPIRTSGVVSVAGLASGTSVFQVSGDFSLKIEPGEPLAGRDVLFTLTGLEPWAEVKVDFVNPIGQAAQSVTDEDVLVVGAGGAPVTESFFRRRSG